MVFIILFDIIVLPVFDGRKRKRTGTGSAWFQNENNINSDLLIIKESEKIFKRFHRQNLSVFFFSRQLFKVASCFIVIARMFYRISAYNSFVFKMEKCLSFSICKRFASTLWAQFLFLIIICSEFIRIWKLENILSQTTVGASWFLRICCTDIYLLFF